MEDHFRISHWEDNHGEHCQDCGKKGTRGVIRQYNRNKSQQRPRVCLRRSRLTVSCFPTLWSFPPYLLGGNYVSYEPDISQTFVREGWWNTRRIPWGKLKKKRSHPSPLFFFVVSGTCNKMARVIAAIFVTLRREATHWGTENYK